MKRNISIAVAFVVILAGIAANYYWHHNLPKSEIVQVQPVPPAPPPPPARQVIDAPPAAAPLPELADSDAMMLDALANLISNKYLMNFFHTERIIHNIVATIDNLPRRRISLSVMPLARVPGKLITSGQENDLTISPRNAARYTPYIQITKALGSKQVIELYVRLYPLFQQAYEDIGYPKQYFNDRLLTVLDELLATPDIREPVKLIQPAVFYLFADPDLEGRGIGQRILMRIGSNNESIIKAWLGSVKQELMLHMHEIKAAPTHSASGE